MVIFFSPVAFGFHKNSFLNRVIVSQLSDYNSPIHVVVRIWGGKAFYNLIIKSKLFIFH
jgi:hypothetical protein